MVRLSSVLTSALGKVKEGLALQLHRRRHRWQNEFLGRDCQPLWDGGGDELLKGLRGRSWIVFHALAGTGHGATGLENSLMPEGFTFYSQHSVTMD